MNKFIKYLTDVTSIKKYSYLRSHMRHPALWRFDSHSVARGVAAGIFSALIPIVPFQSLLGVLIVITIRGNLPIAFIVSWISNPFTYIPIAYFTYYAGNWILGQSSSINISELGKAYFLGIGMVSFGFALTGYLLTIIFWYGYEVIKKYQQTFFKKK